MSRKTMFTEAQIKEMKEIIRTGEPIIALAERLAPRYNVPENSMRSKLYSIAKRTYKIANWNGPKKRKLKAKFTTPTDMPTPTSEPVEMTGKKVVMYSDHVRIYF